jgi:hypothetical protein
MFGVSLCAGNARSERNFRSNQSTPERERLNASEFPGAIFSYEPGMPCKGKPGFFDGLVKNPAVLLEAGLRFNPAPLDNNPTLGIQGQTA